MPSPHIAAGKNLSFWPLGPLFRSGGAFFIRRTFKGAVLYANIVREYIFTLLEEGYNIEIFLEGGRSRSGKLITPKLGLISILINAYQKGACEDLIFVPIFVGYDRVIEESAYLHELKGGQKEPENITQIIKAGKIFKKRYGKIYIKFNEPISIKDVLAQQNRTITDLTAKEINTECRKLGYKILNDIDKVSVVTPHGLVASAILNCSKEIFCFLPFN